jgi:hypothetical protein
MAGGNARIYLVGDNAYGSKLGNIAGGIHNVIDAHDRRSGDFVEWVEMPDGQKLWVTHVGARYFEEFKNQTRFTVAEMKWQMDPGGLSKFFMGDAMHEIEETIGNP